MALDLPKPEDPAYGNTVRSTLNKLDRSVHRDSTGNTEIDSTTATVKVAKDLSVTGAVTATGALTTNGHNAGAGTIQTTGGVQGATGTFTGQLGADRLTVNGGSPAAGQLKGSTVLASGAVTAASVSATGTVDAGTVDASGNFVGASSSQLVLGGDTILKRGAASRMDADAALRVYDGIEIGSGGDVNLFRQAANVLRTNDALEVDGYVSGGNLTVNGTAAVSGAANVSGNATFSSTATLDGALDHNGSTAGFFGNAPVTRRTVNNSTTSGAALNKTASAVRDILFVLGELGLLVDNTSGW